MIWMHNVYICIFKKYSKKNAKQDEFAINHLMNAQFLQEYYLNIHISKISVHYLRIKVYI